MTDQLTLRISNDLGQLRRVRERVEAFGERNELASEIVFKVKLAIEELLTNTIVHGYSDQDEHTIDMRLDLRPDRLNVTITDDATAFDPRDAKIPDTEAPLEVRTEGGLGVHLVNSLMDGIEYRREGSRNHLTLTKKFGSP